MLFTLYSLTHSRAGDAKLCYSHSCSGDTDRSDAAVQKRALWPSDHHQQARRVKCLAHNDKCRVGNPPVTVRDVLLLSDPQLPQYFHINTWSVIF